MKLWELKTAMQLFLLIRNTNCPPFIMTSWQWNSISSTTEWHHLYPIKSQLDLNIDCKSMVTSKYNTLPYERSYYKGSNIIRFLPASKGVILGTFFVGWFLVFDFGSPAQEAVVWLQISRGPYFPNFRRSITRTEVEHQKTQDQCIRAL